MEWPDFPAALIFHCSLLGKLTWWEFFIFFFKCILNIHKIQICTSEVWTCEYFHLGEKLWPYLLLPGLVRISCKNPDAFFCLFLKYWLLHLCSIKDEKLFFENIVNCALQLKKGEDCCSLTGLSQQYLLHTQRMIRTEVNLQLNLIQLKTVFGRVMAGSNTGSFIKHLP